jgi:hypothetical protein
MVLAALFLAWGGPSVGSVDARDLMWVILLAFVAGFLGICATVLSVFDVARSEPSGRDVEP